MASDEEKRRKERAQRAISLNVVTALLAVLKTLAPYSESEYVPLDFLILSPFYPRPLNLAQPRFSQSDPRGPDLRIQLVSQTLVSP